MYSHLSPAVDRRFDSIMQGKGSREDQPKEEENRILLHIAFKGSYYQKVYDINWIGHIAKESVYSTFSRKVKYEWHGHENNNSE